MDDMSVKLTLKVSRGECRSEGRGRRRPKRQSSNSKL